MKSQQTTQSHTGNVINRFKETAFTQGYTDTRLIFRYMLLSENSMYAYTNELHRVN